MNKKDTSVLNTSINSRSGGVTGIRRTQTKTAANLMNSSLNQSLTKTLTTPRRPLGSSGLQKPTSSTKREAMNSSINSQQKKSSMNQSLGAYQKMNTSQNDKQASSQKMEVEAPKVEQSSRLEFNKSIPPVEPEVPAQKVAPVVEPVKMSEDDQEILALKHELEQKPKAQDTVDPKMREQIDHIMKHVSSLKFGDLSKRVDSLVALNDIITRIQVYQDAIVKCADELCAALTHVLVETFEKPLPDIPLRFAKYFVTIVNRVCTSTEIMKACNEHECFELCEQLLLRLLTEGLDKLGDAKEGETILKTLNAAMLRLLDNC